jgi:geranylgeranyl diphosphate synthase type II
LENLKHLSALYADYMAKNTFTGNPETLYAPMNYIMELGGKRVRPLLALLGTEACGGNSEDALLWAHSVEVFHNFTLVHDDIMDNAPTRRGKPTVHEKWGIAEGILSGDNMLIAVYEALLLSDYPQKMELLQLLSKTAREVCEGQQLDMDSATRQTVTEAEYLEMIRLKTAVLLGCSLQGGGICAGVNSDVQQRLYDFAINMGLCFQLNDDRLDAFGDPQLTGKVAGGDIAEGKKTWLYIMANNQGETDMIWNQFSGNERIAPTLSLWRKMGLETALKNKADDYLEKSMEDLEALDAMGIKTTALRELSLWLNQRAH